MCQTWHISWDFEDRQESFIQIDQSFTSLVWPIEKAVKLRKVMHKISIYVGIYENLNNFQLMIK